MRHFTREESDTIQKAAFNKHVANKPDPKSAMRRIETAFARAAAGEHPFVGWKLSDYEKCGLCAHFTAWVDAAGKPRHPCCVCGDCGGAPASGEVCLSCGTGA